MNPTRQCDVELLNLRVLGPFQAVRHREPINLGPVRQQAVLLRLALCPGRTVTGEEILDGVWGEEVPASGIRLVRSYLSRLRVILGREMIMRYPTGYCLDLDPVQVDLTRFDQHIVEARQLRRRGLLGPSAAAWRKAVELWRDPPLPELPGPFADSQRQRLTDLRLSALEECWDTEVLLGRHSEVLVDLSAAARDHPLRESLTRLLMLASYRSGRQADAIAAFEQTRHRLAAELEVRPAPHLQQLYNRIRSGDPQLMCRSTGGSSQQH